jgi:hypothetical protein
MENTESTLDLGVEDLESLEAPIDWGNFWQGFAAGVGLVAVGVGTAALIT